MNTPTTSLTVESPTPAVLSNRPDSFPECSILRHMAEECVSFVQEKIDIYGVGRPRPLFIARFDFLSSRTQPATIMVDVRYERDDKRIDLRSITVRGTGFPSTIVHGVYGPQVDSDHEFWIVDHHPMGMTKLSWKKLLAALSEVLERSKRTERALNGMNPAIHIHEWNEGQYALQKLIRVCEHSTASTKALVTRHY